MRSRTLTAFTSGLLAVAGAAVIAPQAASAATSVVPRPDHVVIVVEENHSGSQIIGNPAAPYINSLAADGANFTASYAVTHPSEPNYLALFSGSTQGLTDDSCPHTYSAPSLGDQLIAAGRTFAGYSESMPSAGYTGCSSGAYARKHNPWVNFPAIPASANQPFTAFPTDYSTLPDVSFVIPNLQNDMHDGTVAQGDTWLHDNLDGYVQWAKTHNSLFVLTFDEDDNSEANRIATVFAGQQVRAGQYGEVINHYNVLRTIEDAFGLTPLGAAATAPPIADAWLGNRPPTAAFTASCPTTTCTFDASGSADPDGTIAGYSWDFGDGTTGTGPAPVHQYATTGQYTPTLTVTDDAGATATASRIVLVGSIQPFVLDTFNRAVTGGLGTADIGGTWSTTGTSSAFAVAPTAATLTLGKPAAQLWAVLPATTRTDADVRAQLALNAVPVGGPMYVAVEGRRVSSGNEYAAKVLVYPDRSVTIRVVRIVGGTETAIAGPVRVGTITYTAGMPLELRLQVTGTGPTLVRARVWPSSASEPTAWSVSASDSTAALQVPGAVGVNPYLSSAATNAPIALSVRNLAASPTTGGNSPPTAAFTASCAQLTCSVDGTASSDPDGTIASWAWDFGDGATGSGATAQHAYVLAGTYTVRLTVTDGAGAIASVTHSVTATPPPANQPPTAAFTPSCTGLACSFDGTASTDDEGVSAWAWDFGDGSTGSGSTATHTYAAAGSYQVRLTVTDADGATGSTTQTVTLTDTGGAFVLDTYNRTVSGGLGTADVGGPWTTIGTASYLSVAPGWASVQLPRAGAQAGGYVGGQTRTDTDLTTSVRLGAVPVGGPVYVTVTGRRVSAGNEYAAKLLVYPDRSVTLRVMRIVGGVETPLAGPVVVPGLTYAAGTVVNVRLQVTATGRTSLRARAWPAAGTEPGTWLVSGTDTTAGLQVAGAVGWLVYLSSAVTNAPLTVSLGPLTARPTGA